MAGETILARFRRDDALKIVRHPSHGRGNARTRFFRRSKSGLGKVRYVVERAIAAVNQNRRKVWYERRDDIHLAFLTLACVKL